MARGRRRRIVFSRQSIPALAFMVLGGIMMSAPYIVEHHGYTNDVMVAAEGLKPPFEKTIILIGQETVDGSIGLILNKPLTDKQRAALSPFLRDAGIPVGYGGPIAVSEKIFVLEEKPSETGDGSPNYEITTWDKAVNDTPDLLDKIRASIKKGEQRYRVFTGYAGWGPFQLESETLAKNKWHALPTTHDLVFQTEPDAQWDAINQQEKAAAKPPVNQS